MTEPLPAKDRMQEYFDKRGLSSTGGLLNFKTFTKVIEAFIDPTAILGPNTIVWHYARVLANCTIGSDCNIGGGAEIGRGTTIGDRTRISSGVFLPSNTVIGSDVFIGPNVTCTDDKYPRTLKPGESYTALPPTIEDHASIGAGAILLPGVRIGRGARVAAGAIVTRDVQAGDAVIGMPARTFTLSKETPEAYLSDFAETRTLGAS
jgi:acetyltransferase-like isoleucine patch superfamily enzyme